MDATSRACCLFITQSSLICCAAYGLSQGLSLLLYGVPCRCVQSLHDCLERPSTPASQARARRAIQARPGVMSCPVVHAQRRGPTSGSCLCPLQNDQCDQRLYPTCCLLRSATSSPAGEDACSWMSTGSLAIRLTSAIIPPSRRLSRTAGIDDE